MSPPRALGPLSAADRWLAAAAPLIAAKRYAEAIPAMRQAAAARSDSAPILCDLGRLFIDAGLPAQAVGPLRRAVAIEPKLIRANHFLGIALEMTRDQQGAIAALEQTTRLKPSISDAHFRLGVLYEDQRRPADAVASYRRAARTADLPSARFVAEARALMVESREDEAIVLLRRALQREPDNAAALGLLGGLLAALGRFAEAAECYDRALFVSPMTAGAHYDLVRCRTITRADEPLLERMDAALSRGGLNDFELCKLQLARGKAFEDLGRYEDAMAAFDAAAAARGRSVRFDLAEFESFADQIIALFSAEFLGRVRPAASADRTPVFVLGMPRSGTTLCEQIMSSHPEAVGGGELAFWNRRARAPQNANGERFDADFIERSAADYLAGLRSISPTAARVVDKNPWNFYWIGLIHMVFPRAAIIHCRRSPIATALSIHQTHFSFEKPFPTGGEALVGYFRVYQRLMAHWRDVLPRGRILDVDYEALTSAPEREIRAIIAHTGLDWDDACLSPQNNGRLVNTPSRWQVRQPINTGSVERWRRYEACLGPLAALIDQQEGA